MTAEESIRRIKRHFEIHNDNRPTPFLSEAVQNAIAALELRVPARPNLISDGDWDGEPVACIQGCSLTKRLVNI